MVITSKLTVTIGDAWIMDNYSVYADASSKYGDLLWSIETDEIKDWFICPELMSMTGATEITFDVVHGSDVVFDLEHFETVPGNYFGRPEDCYPEDESFMQHERLEDVELVEAFREFVLKFEIEE